MRRFVFASILCLAAGSAAIGGPVAVVDAGDSDRIATPVYVDIESSVVPDGAEIAVVENGSLAPAQAEEAADGKVRIWWIVHNLPAGQSREYEILFLKDLFENRFAWRHNTDFTTRLFFGDRPVLEYVHPLFDPDDIENTKKPFHHVFDPDGTRTITKGVGGLYSHHRGLFFGYNKIQVGDQSLDT